MPRRVLDIKQNTPEWLKAREGKATGSNAIVLLTDGIEAAIAKNSGNNFSNGNYWTARGHILEDEAIELYESINDTKVLRVGTVVNTTYERAQCSPDGEDENIDAILEVKSLMPKNHLREIENPSAKYVAQVNFNAVICIRKKALLIYYCPDPEVPLLKKLVVLDVTNKRIQANIKSKLRD